MITKSATDNLTAADVREMLRHIPAPVKGTNSRDDWIKISAAVCSALRGDEQAARAVLEAWSPSWEKNAYENAFKSFGGKYKCTAGTLIYLAKKHGFDARAYFRDKSRASAASAARETDEPAGGTPPAVVSVPVRIGECSLAEAVRKPDALQTVKLVDVLRDVKAGKWRAAVAAVRAGKLEKSTLPQCCAFGVYNRRRADENLISRSGFLALDYDGKDNGDMDFSRLKYRLSRLPFILAVFTSPSGKGLKAVVRVPDGATDAAAFAAACAVLAPLGGKIDAQSAARKHFIVSDDSAAFVSAVPADEIPPLAPWEQLSPAALAVIFAETVERFFFAGKDDYFFAHGAEILPLSAAAAKQEFEYRHAATPKAARAALYAVRQIRAVKKVFPALTCRQRGMSELDGAKILVLNSPRVIEADEGTFPTIRKLLEIALSAGDLWRFLAWFQHARRAFLRAVESNGTNITPVPVLMLLGTAGAGKDLIFQTLINPALGNRVPAPADTFPQPRPWLGKAIGAECILGSEIPNLNRKERENYKSALKKLIAGSGYDAEKKGEDGFSFHGQHFIVLLANIDDGGNCAASLPAIDEDFRDKFLALALCNSAAVKDAFDGENAQKNAAKIIRELPAFLYWLETCFDFPSEWRDKRFGVKNYVSPAAQTAIFEVSTDFDVLAKLEEIAEKDRDAVIVNTPKSAAAIARIIAEKFFEKPLPPRVIGTILRKLAKSHPDVIRWNESKSSPRYTLFRRAPVASDPATDGADAGTSVSPFAGLPF